MNSHEYFTLEKLAEFYADAAKAGSMEFWVWDTWHVAKGPNLGSLVGDYRIKPAPPIVRWMVRFEDKTPYHKLFDTEKDADDFIKSWPEAKVIKLVEQAE